MLWGIRGLGDGYEVILGSRGLSDGCRVGDCDLGQEILGEHEVGRDESRG